MPKAVADGGGIVYNIGMKTIAVYIPLFAAVALGVCPARASAQMLARPARRVVAPVRQARPVAPVRPAVGPLRRSYGPQWGGWGGWGGWMYTNVYEGPDSLHRPWAGSDTYYKNLGRRSQDGGRADAQRDRDSTLDAYRSEEARAARIQREEAARAEMQQKVKENKAVIDANRRAAEAERRAREAERLAEIRARAAEQEREIMRRRAEQEKVHDAILNALPPCAARLEDGRPCPRKANPGSHYCYRHLDWADPLPQKAPSQP